MQNRLVNCADITNGDLQMVYFSESFRDSFPAVSMLIFATETACFRVVGFYFTILIPGALYTRSAFRNMKGMREGLFVKVFQRS